MRLADRSSLGALVRRRRSRDRCPSTAVDAALAAMGNAVDGKTVVDVTNVLSADGKPALGFTTSGAEQLQKNAPSAKVVKAFNMIFAQNVRTGMVKRERLVCLAAGDAGPLVNARWLESLGIGFAIVR